MTSLAINPSYATSSKVAIWAATLMVLASIVFSLQVDRQVVLAPSQPHLGSAEWRLRGTLKPFDPPFQSVPLPAVDPHVSGLA